MAEVNDLMFHAEVGTQVNPLLLLASCQMTAPKMVCQTVFFLCLFIVERQINTHESSKEGLVAVTQIADD